MKNICTGENDSFHLKREVRALMQVVRNGRREEMKFLKKFTQNIVQVSFYFFQN